ncbi:hypothetical protein M514_19107 [Trichuris suis]|uniref:Mos1 transposase HTH domain-containing protein n=1 Tax=Trichuris suis TaxID=68888 RepID=A0A085NGR8_9BILA|nr:hypothetical protein M514_19107 [Trichuris suis]
MLLFQYNEGLCAAAAAEKIHPVYREETTNDRGGGRWISRFTKPNFDLSAIAMSGSPGDFD